VIVDGENGVLADVEQPDALGDAIVRLIRDDALRARVRANAAARAHEFSVERMTDRTITVYENVLASRGRSRTAATSASNSASVTRAP